jgi:hypothetical protein
MGIGSMIRQFHPPLNIFKIHILKFYIILKFLYYLFVWIKSIIRPDESEGF